MARRAFAALLWAAGVVQALPAPGAPPVYSNGSEHPTQTPAAQTIHLPIAAEAVLAPSNASESVDGLAAPTHSNSAEQWNRTSEQNTHLPLAAEAGLVKSNGSKTVDGPATHWNSSGYWNQTLAQNLHLPLPAGKGHAKYNGSNPDDGPTRPPQPTPTPPAQAKANFTRNGPMKILAPSVHWSVDRSNSAHLKPSPPGEGLEMFYGNNDPLVAGHFAFVNFMFKSAAVFLDNSAFLEAVFDKWGALVINFLSRKAFDLAQGSWTIPDGEHLILVGFIQGCGDFHLQERCYFKASNIVFDAARRVVRAVGNPSHPDEIVSEGKTRWGLWIPDASPPHQAHRRSQPESTSVGGFPFQVGAASSKAGGLSARATEAGETGSSFNASACVPPVDSTYNLPTACLGEYFDEALDRQLGAEDMTAMVDEFFADLNPQPGAPDSPASPRQGIQRRDLFWLKTKVVETIKAVYKAAKAAISIGGSINRQFSWILPEAKSRKWIADQLKDIMPIRLNAPSPWPDSILLKGFGNQRFNASSALNQYMNVYCVGCGVSGTARVAGHARWTPLGGFVEGHVELNTDIQFNLKVGIDAQLIYSDQFKLELFSVGLPGLTYGIVTIAPHITVDSRVELAAAAKGKLLVGAEMGLQSARLVWDIIDPSQNKKSGWEPYFRPIFEAEGEIMLSARLALPVKMQCGLKIGGWDKSVGFIDEPSVKGVAQFAGSIGKGSSRGKSPRPNSLAVSGPKSLAVSGPNSLAVSRPDGCSGISTQLSWRNRLWINVIDITSIPMEDTQDVVLSRGCINMPSFKKPSMNDKIVTKTNHLPSAEPKKKKKARPKALLANSTDPETDPPAGLMRALKGTPRKVERRNEVTFESDMIMDGRPETSQDGGTVKQSSGSYSDNRGHEVTMVLDPNNTTALIACSNGNIFAVLADGEQNPSCSGQWISNAEKMVLHDATNRVMHYYENTLSVVGVSRFRVGVKSALPRTSKPVALVTYPDDSGGYFYIAVGPGKVILYPIVCDFSDGTGSKVFLAKSLDEGVAMLERQELTFSITGGYVRKCSPMALNRGPLLKNQGRFA
ncbi:hypothetical protein RJ55_02159 [Drechmeria coniospora]|nr:hypothetical protein RJ55_02159 [Drechmeria coniospora]